MMYFTELCVRARDRLYNGVQYCGMVGVTCVNEYSDEMRNQTTLQGSAVAQAVAQSGSAWQQTLSHTWLFALKDALRRFPNATHFLRFEDDMALDVRALASLPLGDVICLLEGEAYCGATAYIFSRSFAHEFLDAATPEYHAT